MPVLEHQMVCPKCKEPGRHFVQPSMGKYGYFSCDDADEPEQAGAS